jgi:hypothetical protein
MSDPLARWRAHINTFGESLMRSWDSTESMRDAATGKRYDETTLSYASRYKYDTHIQLTYRSQEPKVRLRHVTLGSDRLLSVLDKVLECVEFLDVTDARLSFSEVWTDDPSSWRVLGKRLERMFHITCVCYNIGGGFDEYTFRRILGTVASGAFPDAKRVDVILRYVELTYPIPGRLPDVTPVRRVVRFDFTVLRVRSYQSSTELECEFVEKLWLAFPNIVVLHYYDVAIFGRPPLSTVLIERCPAVIYSAFGLRDIYPQRALLFAQDRSVMQIQQLPSYVDPQRPDERQYVLPGFKLFVSRLVWSLAVYAGAGRRANKRHPLRDSLLAVHLTKMIRDFANYDPIEDHPAANSSEMCPIAVSQRHVRVGLHHIDNPQPVLSESDHILAVFLRNVRFGMTDSNDPVQPFRLDKLVDSLWIRNLIK